MLVRMLFASRPGDIGTMGVVDMKHFPFKGYKSMAWCGHIIHRIGTTKVDEKCIRHESIHLLQAKVCGRWWKFYLSYLWEWIKGGIIIAPVSAAYYTSKYESEAYANEDNPDYCVGYDGSNLPKYSFKNRKKLYKAVGGTSRSWKQYVKTL